MPEPDGPGLSLIDGPGETRGLFRSTDWSATPLGPVDGWSPVLRTMVEVCLGSGFPIVIHWGPDCVAVYNDAFAAMIGGKHPAAFGRPARADLAGGVGPGREPVDHDRPGGSDPARRGRAADHAPQRVSGGVLLLLLAQPDHRRARERGGQLHRGIGNHREGAVPAADAGGPGTRRAVRGRNRRPPGHLPGRPGRAGGHREGEHSVRHGVPGRRRRGAAPGRRLRPGVTGARKRTGTGTRAWSRSSTGSSAPGRPRRSRVCAVGSRPRSCPARWAR